MQTIPSRASDAGPQSTPMDLGDFIFESEWSAELANKSHKLGKSKADIRARLEEARDAIESALELL